MNRIKDNWTESDIFHASDLNDISGLANELVDEQQTVINDEQAGNNCTYSSNKAIECINTALGTVINDEQIGEDTAYSSNKVDELVKNSSFSIEIVDDLPVEGEENILYMSPSDSTPEPSDCMPMLMYNGVGGVINIDTDYLGDERVYKLNNISIGDVIRYKEPDTNTQTFLRTYRTPIFYVDKTTTLFSGEYNIGETFTASSTMGNDFLVTSYDSMDLGIDWSQIYGITGSIGVETGKVYRLIGYSQISDRNINMDGGFTDKYDTYVAIFEDVTEQVSVADHNVDYLGSIFTKNKARTKQYAVLSEIDKNKLMGTVDYGDMANNMNSQSEYILQVTNGVLGTLTLQDGHCYRLKDRYMLKAKNIGGNCVFDKVLDRYGAEALVYEEVLRDEEADYEDIEFVPSAMWVTGHVYGERIKWGWPIWSNANGYYFNSNLKAYEIPSGLKVGDVVKITGYNPWGADSVMAPDMPSESQIRAIGGDLSIKKAYCVTSAGTNISTSIGKNEMLGRINARGANLLYGIISAQQWEKDECYRLTRLCRIDSKQLFGEFPGYFGGDATIEGFVPVFEKVSNTENVDYEVSGLPGVILSIVGKAQARNKWMWIDGEWERIGEMPIPPSKLIGSLLP